LRRDGNGGRFGFFRDRYDKTTGQRSDDNEQQRKGEEIFHGVLLTKLGENDKEDNGDVYKYIISGAAQWCQAPGGALSDCQLPLCILK
jgi:hypothetical protein